MAGVVKRRWYLLARQYEAERVVGCRGQLHAHIADQGVAVLAVVTYTSRNTDCESATPTRSNPAVSANRAFATAAAMLRGIPMMPNFIGSVPMMRCPFRCQFVGNRSRKAVRVQFFDPPIGRGVLRKAEYARSPAAAQGRRNFEP